MKVYHLHFMKERVCAHVSEWILKEKGARALSLNLGGMGDIKISWRFFFLHAYSTVK